MDFWDLALEPLRVLAAQTAALLPRMLLAALILLAGWAVAKALRLAAVKALRAMNFHVLTERAGTDTLLQQGGARFDTVGLIGLLAFWLTLLAALVLAFNSLGLAYVTQIVGDLALFVLRLMVAVVIVAVGAYFARFVETAVCGHCRDVGLADAELLGVLARYGVLVFVALIALDQADLGGTLLRDSFLILLAGLVFALALAFGLAGRERAAELLERWRSRRHDRAPPHRGE